MWINWCDISAGWWSEWQFNVAVCTQYCMPIITNMIAMPTADWRIYRFRTHARTNHNTLVLVTKMSVNNGCNRVSCFLLFSFILFYCFSSSNTIVIDIRCSWKMKWDIPVQTICWTGFLLFCIIEHNRFFLIYKIYKVTGEPYKNQFTFIPFWRKSFFGFPSTFVYCKAIARREFCTMDLGKRLLECAKNGETSKVYDLLGQGAMFITDWVCVLLLIACTWKTNWIIPFDNYRIL